MMMRAALFLGVILLLMAPMLLASPAQSLQVRTDTGALVWCTAVSRHDTVQLQFTHSMFGGYVREQWRVTPGNELQRVRFVTENAAAAEYYATDGTSYHADDGYVVPGEPLQQPVLVVRVNQRGNHYLSVGGTSVHLAGLVSQSTQVRIALYPQSCDEAD
jgi:hypothetical protein